MLVWSNIDFEGVTLPSSEFLNDVVRHPGGRRGSSGPNPETMARITSWVETRSRKRCSQLGGKELGGEE